MGPTVRLEEQANIPQVKSLPSLVSEDEYYDLSQRSSSPSIEEPRLDSGKGSFVRRNKSENNFKNQVYPEDDNRPSDSDNNKQDEHRTPPILIRLHSESLMMKKNEKVGDADCESFIGISESEEESEDEKNGKEVVKKYNEDQASESSFGILGEAVEVACDISKYWLEKGCQFLFPVSLRRSLIRHEMERANSYNEWRALALELDRIEGKEEWKMTFESNLYDNATIERRLEDLRMARNENIMKMRHLLRTGLFRNLGNMGNPALYNYCAYGTKRLIEKYIEEVVYQLTYLAEIASDNKGSKFTLNEAMTFFKDTRQAFGRSALLLSGGGALGSYHHGVCKVLFENNLLPRVICGSSVGAIVAAILGCKNDQELQVYLHGKPEDIMINAFAEDTEYEILRKFKRLFEEGVLADHITLRNAVKAHIGDMTFQEAYNRTNRILNVTVNSTNPHEPWRLLNFLTAPNVVVWSAVCASCSLQILFAPQELIAKDKHGNLTKWGITGESWSDGSVESDLPTVRLSELFNVNHFIVSQINPHVMPFIHPNSPINSLAKYSPRLSEIALLEIRHRLSQVANLGIPGTLGKLLLDIENMWLQSYHGDITIIPSIELKDFPKILHNPTPEYVQRTSKIGERAAWEKIAIIRIHCEVELTLDRLYLRMRERLFEHKAQLNTSLHSHLSKESKRHSVR